MSSRQILLGAIKARSAVKKLSKRRRGNPPRQRFPTEAVLSYKRSLLNILRSCAKQVRNILYPKLDVWFPDITTDSVRLDAIEDELSGFSTMLDRIKEVFSNIDERASAAASAAALVVDKVNKDQIAKQFKSMTGLDVGLLMPDAAKTVEDFVAANVALIRTIPENLFGDMQRGITETNLSELHAILVDADNRGLHSSAIQEQIEERFGVSESRAELIARDQVGKLNAAFTKERQTGLGISQYRWTTLSDERVRESHQELDGQVFGWDDPPEVGHPGEDFQCRCIATPLLDELFNE